MNSNTVSPKLELRDYEVVIRANTNWLRFDWHAIVEYRDLLLLLIRRDFVAKYKQTLLGPVWFLIQPLLTTAVFTVVFGRFTNISTEGAPRMLFYLCGLLAWNYFSHNLTNASNVFTLNAPLFGKVYFPRVIVPLSIVISNLAAFFLQLLLYVCFLAYFVFFVGAQIDLGLPVLLLPALIVYVAALSLGICLWMSALTAKYRDLMHLMAFLTQLWMFATPVIYPLSDIPKKWHGWISLNPMTGVVEAFRYCLLGTGSVEPRALLISITITIVTLFTGVLMYQRTERTFIDTV